MFGATSIGRAFPATGGVVLGGDVDGDRDTDVVVLENRSGTSGTEGV